MNPDVFFENFEMLAEAPNCVQKLRELILQLAVMGKLVPQNPDDEPASVLIEKINIEDINKKLEEVSQIAPEDCSFEIPNTWQWVRLSQIVRFNIGRTPKTKVAGYWDEEGVPWVSIADMPHYGKIFSTKKCVSLKAIKEVFRCEPVPAGTLLMSFKLTIGKVSLLEVDAFHNEAIISIFPACPESRDFLFRVLPVMSRGGKTNSAIKGQTLNKSSLSDLLIPLPPLAEQKRIVAKVDELMALCDQLEARQQKKKELRSKLNSAALDEMLSAESQDEFEENWRSICENFDLLYDNPENVEELRKAILQLAVQGKLVEQDEADEPASALIEKIRAEKKKLIKEGKIKKTKQIPAICSDELPYDIPENWNWTRLGDIASSLRYGTSKKCTYEPSGVPVLRIPNLINGKINTDDLKFTHLTEKEREDLKLELGDLLLIRSNGSTSLVGRSAVIDGGLAGYAYAGYLVRLRTFPEEVFSDYLHIALDSRYVRDQIELPIRTTSGVKNINSTEISKLIIPLPPLNEQKRIVEKVAQLMGLCDELEAKLRKGLEESERLMQAVVRGLLESAAAKI